MYAFLGGYQLTRDIGSQYEYSNFGAGLLGHALTLRTRVDRLRGARPRARARAARDDQHGGHALAVDEVAARGRPFRDAGAHRQLGPAGARGRRRAAIDDQRPADVSRGEHRLRQDAAGAGDGGHADSPPADRKPEPRDRARLARADDARQGAGVAQRRHRRVSHVHRLRPGGARRRRRPVEFRNGGRPRRHRPAPARYVAAVAAGADAAQDAHRNIRWIRS